MAGISGRAATTLSKTSGVVRAMAGDLITTDVLPDKDAPQRPRLSQLSERYGDCNSPSSLSRCCSAIFYTTDEQLKIAEDTIADVEAPHLGAARW